ncbi:hypothetical protein BUALT_Bualt03G0072700 [Buddleja alternifolia]|uniref:Uncharacterized protein n=1 Tax=Buddleja alternifolia TaxID=168488 RepID=A0AAV6Y2K2_9LAMI|nr:hypothetical protein BUALT_Bualt03G0072700 [Buddleja alternifolia]
MPGKLIEQGPLCVMCRLVIVGKELWLDLLVEYYKIIERKGYLQDVFLSDLKVLLPCWFLSSPAARFMSDLDIQIPCPFDPFAEAKAEDSGAGSKEYVHIRVQQRNGRKSLTTVQGLKKEFSYNKILKDLKKEFCCNGTVVQDPELGQVIQLQGDQRKNVSTFLVQAGIVKKDRIKIHEVKSKNHAQVRLSEDEEELVIRMYNLVGERWSLIAGRIPGRSADEIKNYWMFRDPGSSLKKQKQEQ